MGRLGLSWKEEVCLYSLDVLFEEPVRLLLQTMNQGRALERVQSGWDVSVCIIHSVLV